jgi:hypothetical protein
MLTIHTAIDNMPRTMKTVRKPTPATLEAKIQSIVKKYIVDPSGEIIALLNIDFNITE